MISLGLQLNISTFFSTLSLCLRELLHRTASQYDTVMVALCIHNLHYPRERERERDFRCPRILSKFSKYCIDYATSEPIPGTKGMSCTEWHRTGLSEAIIVQTEETEQDLDL